MSNAHFILRLLFIFFLPTISSIYAELRLELPDNIIIVIQNPNQAIEAVPLEAKLVANSFSIEYENNNPVIVSHSGRTSFNPQKIASTSYEQFREYWMNDSCETCMRIKVDPAFHAKIISQLNHVFNHMLQTNSQHIYDRILARLSLAQIAMDEEPYHTNISLALQQLNKKFFDSKGTLKTIDQEYGVADIINQCALYCGIQKKFSCQEPKDNRTFAQKAKALFGGCNNITQIMLNATNRAIINCLQFCKKLDFIKAEHIARTSPDPLLLQRIIEQYKQEVNAALYDADGIYRHSPDDPIYKQLTPAAKKQLKNNTHQRALFNTHLRSRAAMKNSLMERWHIDQSAPASVHRALTVRAYNFTALTPKECGPQVGMWFDYDHIFGPSALINCKKNTRECVGFHHDYQGKIRNSGLVEFNIIKNDYHGVYEAEWSYNNALFKGSTFFSDDWRYAQILEKIIEASKNIQSYKFDQRKNSFALTGITAEGITTEIILEVDSITKYPTGKITSAYPIIRE